MQSLKSRNERSGERRREGRMKEGREGVNDDGSSYRICVIYEATKCSIVLVCFAIIMWN